MVWQPTDGLKLSLLDRFAAPLWADDAAPREDLAADLPDNHVARLIDRVVANLDMQTLLESYSGRGRKPHRPDLLVRVVLYEMHCGCQSPCQWARDLRHNNVVRWLARGICPALSVLYEFRDRLDLVAEAWHQQVVAEIQKLQADVTDIATLDGTSLEANASRHKMFSSETVDKHLEQLAKAQEQEAQEVAEAAETAGATVESAVEPAFERPEWMAKTSAGRQRQMERHQHARQRLQALHERNSRRPKDKQLPRKHVRVSVTDPESASGRDKHNVYRPLYNVQLLWSLKAPVILTFEVFSHHGDHGMLPILVEKMLNETGQKPKTLLVDSAYTAASDLSFCELHGIELYGPWQENDFTKDRPSRKNPRQIPKAQFTYDPQRDVYQCPQRHDLAFEGYKYKPRCDGEYVRYRLFRCSPEHCRVCPLATQCAKMPDKGRTLQRHPQQELIDALQARMATPEARAYYRQRGQGERPFADLKTHRHLRRLSGRGQQRVRTQTALAVLTHNLMQLDTLKQSRTTGLVAPNLCKTPA
jgi:transposase